MGMATASMGSMSHRLLLAVTHSFKTGALRNCMEGVKVFGKNDGIVPLNSDEDRQNSLNYRRRVYMLTRK